MTNDDILLQSGAVELTEFSSPFSSDVVPTVSVSDRPTGEEEEEEEEGLETPSPAPAGGEPTPKLEETPTPTPAPKPTPAPTGKSTFALFAEELNKDFEGFYTEIKPDMTGKDFAERTKSKLQELRQTAVADIETAVDAVKTKRAEELGLSPEEIEIYRSIDKGLYNPERRSALQMVKIASEKEIPTVTDEMNDQQKLERVESMKEVMRVYHGTLNYKPEDSEKLIEALETRGQLESAVAEAKPELKKTYDGVLAKIAADQKRQKEEQETYTQESMASATKILTESKDDFFGFKLTDEDIAAIPEYLYKRTEVLQVGNQVIPKSKFEIEHNEQLQDPKNLLFLALLLRKKFDVTPVKAAGKAEKSQEVETVAERFDFLGRQDALKSDKSAPYDLEKEASLIF